MREAPEFRPILERLDEIFPDKNTLTTADMAKYCGVTERTMRKYLSKNTDKVIFARWLCGRKKKGKV